MPLATVVDKDGQETERVMLPVRSATPRPRRLDRRDEARQKKYGQVGIVGYDIPSNRHFYFNDLPRPLEEIGTALSGRHPGDDQENTDVSEISIFSPLKDKLRERRRLRAISVKELLNLDSLTRKHWRGISKQAAKDDMWTQK